ncbi:MAG: AAA family ATPase [Spirochaetes bacterium]|nr:AAA family ATPase [Spirochaetota bacterium]
MNTQTPKVIAFCGKGGSGKTSVCTIVIKYLMGTGKKILAIDADPAEGLSWALGVTPSKTLDDLRQSLSHALNTKQVTNKDELYAMAHYELLSGLIEHKGFDFLAVGRPEAEGCFCSINSFLRHCIGLLVQHYDVVCIDGEAGLEQVNRRVLDTVNHIIIVSDTSLRSMLVSKSLIALSKERMNGAQCSIIINKVGDSYCEVNGLPVIGTLPLSETICRFDTAGKSLLEIDENDEFYVRLKEIIIPYI